MDEDIAMEAFETALERISDYNALKGEFSTWVYRIGRNLFLKRKRKEKREPTFFAEDLLLNYDEADTGGDDREEWVAPSAYSEEVYGDFFKTRFIDPEFRQQVEKAIRMLPKRDRVVLRDYCEGKGKKFTDGDRKAVFKRLRVQLSTVVKAEEA